MATNWTKNFPHPVEVQKSTPVEDSQGTPKAPTWSTYYKTRAKIETPTGTQAQLAQQGQATMAFPVRMRYVPGGLDPTYHLVFKGRTFSILSVANIDERNRELLLMCREVVIGQGA